MTASSYDEIAEWYDSWLGSGALRDDPYWMVGSYHRALSIYVNTLAGAGLALQRVSEPRAGRCGMRCRPC
jgi:hypothetical protein